MVCKLGKYVYVQLVNKTLFQNKQFESAIDFTVCRNASMQRFSIYFVQENSGCLMSRRVLSKNGNNSFVEFNWFLQFIQYVFIHESSDVLVDLYMKTMEHLNTCGAYCNYCRPPDIKCYLNLSLLLITLWFKMIRFHRTGL